GGREGATEKGADQPKSGNEPVSVILARSLCRPHLCSPLACGGEGLGVRGGSRGCNTASAVTEFAGKAHAVVGTWPGVVSPEFGEPRGVSPRVFAHKTNQEHEGA